MDFIFPAAFTALLLGCAYYDLKFMKVPDLLTALLWASLFLPFLLFNLAVTWSLFTMAGVAFGLTYLLNAAIVASGRQFFLSWADVLGFPPYFAAMMFLDAPPLVTAGPLVLSLLASSLRKEKRVPLFPFLAIAFGIYFAMNVAT